MDDRKYIVNLNFPGKAEQDLEINTNTEPNVSEPDPIPTPMPIPNTVPETVPGHEPPIKKNKYFFGWTNIKWVIIETINLYSNKDSFFSKKRIESGIAFMIAQTGMVFYLWNKYSTMSVYDFLLWASVEFAVSGYIVNQIQKEKKDEYTPPQDPTQPPIF
jgi:hypothetical protein